VVIQGHITTQAVLAEVGPWLVDLCGQHEHVAIAAAAKHMELLDAYAVLDDELESYGTVYRAWQEAEKARRALLARVEENRLRADSLRDQLEELARVDPQPGELETLVSRSLMLRDASRWLELAGEIESQLVESDEAITSRLGAMVDRIRRMRAGGALESTITSLVDPLEAAIAAVDDAARVASGIGRILDVEEGELDRVEARRFELERLARRCGGSIESALARRASLEQELAELDDAEPRIRKAEAEVAALRTQVEARADRLHRGRVAAARDLASALGEALRALHLPHARCELVVEPLVAADDTSATADTRKFGPRGRDRVELRFSANPGEPLQPLSKVASGGELSRVLLALKGVLFRGDAVSTSVFDEVDAGVGGIVGDAIGHRLWSAAQGRQILCITHLPQVAACGDVHLHVAKQVEGGRTSTRVLTLDGPARVEELARMLGGSLDSARGHAKVLLDAGARAGEGAMGSGSKGVGGSTAAEVADVVPQAKGRRVAKAAKAVGKPAGAGKAAPSAAKAAAAAVAKPPKAAVGRKFAGSRQVC
jgi:DNA repair protein RecN (Recombination protein N)